MPTLPSLPALPPWFQRHFAAQNSPFLSLLERFIDGFRMSHSQTEQLCKMTKDLADWSELPSVEALLQKQLQEQLKDSTKRSTISPQQRQETFAAFVSLYQSKQSVWPSFQHSQHNKAKKIPQYQFETLKDSRDRILGNCPVASVKTRCCNLLTLDAIQQCGFACSYCAIQHFYDDKAIQVHSNFAQKLQQIELEPTRWYHIGTGQASDSLLWSDKLGIMEPLIEFAQRYPRVILELKSKSSNVHSLLERDLPSNMLFTWSLNPDSFIQHEEGLTASLDARLSAARRMADKGVKVGFHFHPIVRYDGWKDDYSQLIERLCGLFAPSEVVCVSLGALTFSKSTLKTIRHKASYTQILRFPMEEVAGKYSYPNEVKLELFRHLYTALQIWHSQVFFYLCMEDSGLWQQVFGQEYPNNDEFEQDMLENYRQKMGLK